VGIVRTRRGAAAGGTRGDVHAEMRPRQDSARGVLDRRRGTQRFCNHRFWPAPDLADLVEHYWIVSWDLRGRPAYEQETLPHPAVHLVFEAQGAHLYGVYTRRFARRLEGTGRAVGVRFRPAGFRPWLGGPVRALTDRTVPAADALGLPVRRLAGTLGDRTADQAATPSGSARAPYSASSGSTSASAPSG
jgi:hypothetical protein